MSKVGTKTYLDDIFGDGLVAKIAGATSLIASIVISVFFISLRFNDTKLHKKTNKPNFFDFFFS
jgi:hypothetical protein